MEFTDIFNEPYDINRHEYTGKLKLDGYIYEALNDFPDDTNWEDYFKVNFIKDIVRASNCTVNENSDNICTRFSGTNEMAYDEKYEYLSKKFDEFIRYYVPLISNDDIKKFKALNTQHCFSPIIVHFFKMFDGKYGINLLKRLFHYTLDEHNYKFNITNKYEVILPENGESITIGNISFSMLFDIKNNSYSANIQLHMNPPQPAQPVQQVQASQVQPQPANQDECFTFIKRLFRTGGTRKKSKVYGMPYTYRKVYRKKCYKVSNRLSKRIFSKCTTKKKALKQLRLLRYLESK